jgi:hypothetical protein
MSTQDAETKANEIKEWLSKQLSELLRIPSATDLAEQLLSMSQDEAATYATVGYFDIVVDHRA